MSQAVCYLQPSVIPMSGYGALLNSKGPGMVIYAERIISVDVVSLLDVVFSDLRHWQR